MDSGWLGFRIEEEEDHDAQTSLYLAEMRREVALRLREELWQEIQAKVAKEKEAHYRKWRRTKFNISTTTSLQIPK